MTWVVGNVVSATFYLGPTGETFARASARIDGEDADWDPTFTETGNGFYRWAYTPQTAAPHEWAGTSTSGIPVSINEPHVITAAQADPLGAPVAGYADGTAGNRLANLDAAVSTRAAADAWTTARAAKLDRIGSNAEIVAAGTLAAGDRLEFRRGDSYLAADGYAKQWTYSGPAIASATLTLRTFAGATVMQKAVTLADAILTAADITSDETAALALGTPIYRYEIVATLAGGGTSTLVSGETWVKD